MSLHLGTTTSGERFELPFDALTTMATIVGRRGSGKTHTASVLAEEFVEAGLPIVILDPLGVWWGLRSSADGECPGLPVTILGGAHGDVALEEKAGVLVADLVVEHPGAYIIDLSSFGSHEQERRFATDFAERLYRLKEAHRDALGLVIDEADLFAPQQSPSGDKRMLGAFENIARRGRSRGLGMVAITQRPAVLNKNVMSQTELLISHQVTSPHDRKALLDWAQGNATPDEIAAFTQSLAKLHVGEAWMWSPAWLSVFERVQVRHRRTFDSSATPKAGETRVEPRTLASVDLDALRERMAEMIEKAEAEDPRKLQAQIRDLKRQLTERPSAECGHEEVIRDLQADLERHAGALSKMRLRIAEVLGGFTTIRDEINSLLEGTDNEADTVVTTSSVLRVATASHGVSPARTQQTAVRSRRETGSRTSDTTLGKAERAILTALAQNPEGLVRQPLAILTGYAYSGGFRNSLSALRSAGYVEGDNQRVMSITAAGLTALGDFDDLPQGRDLIDYWLADRRLGKAEKAVLAYLTDFWPNELGGPVLAAEVGYEYSGGFRNALSKLRTLGLIEGRNASVRASEVFFR